MVSKRITVCCVTSGVSEVFNFQYKVCRRKDNFFLCSLSLTIVCLIALYNGIYSATFKIPALGVDFLDMKNEWPDQATAAVMAASVSTKDSNIIRFQSFIKYSVILRFCSPNYLVRYCFK